MKACPRRWSRPTSSTGTATCTRNRSDWPSLPGCERSSVSPARRRWSSRSDGTFCRHAICSAPRWKTTRRHAIRSGLPSAIPSGMPRAGCPSGVQRRDEARQSAMLTDPRRRVYLLSPRQLSPETIAVTFAKTSRSPQTFREIADELSDEKSAAFHEKWVVGYGHASVAEHAVLHLAFEGVSRLAIECLESNRLASYTEKSTRYQKWDRGEYHLPAELAGHPLQAVYREACDVLFTSYLDSLEPVRRVVQRLFPRKDGETDERWDGRIRARYVDGCRFFLPAAALANVGMTANARTLEHAIRKMLAHPLEEVRQMGRATKDVATGEVPTLLKYAEPTPHLVRRREAVQSWLRQDLPGEGREPVRLLHMNPASEMSILAAALFPHEDAALDSIVERLQALPPGQLDLLAEAIMGGRDRFDSPEWPQI